MTEEIIYDETDLIKIDVPGIPAPGGSKKGFYNKKAGRVIITDAGGQKNKNWRALVVMATYQAMEENGWQVIDFPVELRLELKMPRPKSHFNSKGQLKPSAPYWHTKRPDITKLIRSTEDALTDAGIWQDDSLVSIQRAIKRYCIEGEYRESPGVQIIIRKILL